MSLVLIYDKFKLHAEKVYNKFYFLKIAGNLRLLDYYSVIDAEYSHVSCAVYFSTKMPQCDKIL